MAGGAYTMKLANDQEDDAFAGPCGGPSSAKYCRVWGVIEIGGGAGLVIAGLTVWRGK
jgi:hypothetical protein